MKYLFLLLLIPTHLVLAQSKPTQVHTYVERMPELLGGGGMAGIIGEFSKRLHIPAFNDDGNTRYSGIHVAFTVGADGQIRDIAMAKSSNNVVIDKAVLAAVRSLPKFSSPGYQAGKAVPVRMTIPISCIKPQF